jgi:hypothetical protein
LQFGGSDDTSRLGCRGPRSLSQTCDSFARERAAGKRVAGPSNKGNGP